MLISNSGFLTGNGLDYLPGIGGASLGIFNGFVRSAAPNQSGKYGLVYSKTSPDLEKVDVNDFNLTYFYGYKDISTTYFSGNFNTPTSELYETCHGQRNESFAYRNFYPAYYRYGYFEQPWNNISTRTSILSSYGVDPLTNKVLKRLTPSSSNTAQDFANGLSINLTEYHQLNGINPINCGPGVKIENCDPTISPIQSFRYLYYDCPQDITVKSPAYQEAEIKWNPGDGNYHVGAGLFNYSPIPNVLDNIGSYDLNDSCAGSSDVSVYNNSKCPAIIFETDSSSLRGSNSLLPDYVANVTAGFGPLGLGGNGVGNFVDGPGAGGQQVANEDWWYWHFSYKENSQTFPFNNNSQDGAFIDSPTKTITNADGSISTITNSKSKGGNAAIQTFVSQIAQENWYWDHRLCPDFPKFLPWTFGGTIFACPETYFEVPYYSAIEKFGFYGTRFLNSQGSLIDETGKYLTGCNEDQNPLSYNAGQYGNDIYDSLLEIASLQRKYSDYYAGNKGLVLALNYDIMITDSSFYSFSGSVADGLKKLHDIFWNDFKYSGIGSPYLKLAWMNDAPKIKNVDGFLSINTSGYLRNVIPKEYLYTNNLYDEVFPSINLSSSASSFINKYSKYVVLNTSLDLDTIFYSYISTGQTYILEKRAYAHQINGYPVDLFPLNRIYYTSDTPSGYQKANWSASSFNTKALPQIERKYFQGYYSDPKAFLIDKSKIQVAGTVDGDVYNSTDNPYGFNPGFFNTINSNKFDFGRQFIRTSSVNIYDKKSSSLFSHTGLSLLGYNEIGKFDGNFSCFNPIFVQQPADVICKIGQAPTFRALAVDYHTLPEDKIKGSRWPEINYWAQKLKLVDSKDKSLYPLVYKWGRVPIENKSQYYMGDLTGIDWASRTGEWCCIESDGLPTCTLIHPKLCHPSLTGISFSVTPGAGLDSVSYLQGSIKGLDDSYLYFCLVSGRFGIRRSELSNLIIDDILTLDISFKNASPKSFAPKLVLSSLDRNNAVIKIPLETNTNVGSFYGLAPDPLQISERSLAERRTANALGCLPSWSPCCNDNKKRPMSAVGYSSWTYSWQPANVQDLPMLNSSYGKTIGYGGLVSFTTVLSQSQGESLYGRTHLPKVKNGAYIGEYQGIPFDLFLNGSTKTKHWSVDEIAWATDTTQQGIPFNNGDIVSALYPPSDGAFRYKSYPTEQSDQSYGKGHWQFSNNLGLVKRLGYLDVPDDGSSWDGKDSNGQILINFSYSLKDKGKLLSNIKKSLAPYPGGSAIWRKSSLGRHMAFFVEGFDSFYTLCGNKKKEFVKNLSFVAPGLRVGNAGFQYAWIGQPNSSYLSRQILPGPYAYFWKVNKHNRDRNGNGMPLGMYSYGTDAFYSMMYDIPAVYGLHVLSNRHGTNSAKIARIKAIRDSFFTSSSQAIGNGGVKYKNRFEFNSSDNVDKSTYWCGIPNGNAGYSCSGVIPVGDTPQEYCDYPNLTIDISSNPDLSIYDCSPEQVKAGACFHPCLSLRYDQGIIPGGKKLNLFGNGINGTGPTRVIGDASYDNVSVGDDKVLGPKYTPWSQSLDAFLSSSLNSKIEQYKSIDPCNGGGSDHCNYITPTAWIGNTQKAFSNINYMNTLISNFS